MNRTFVIDSSVALKWFLDEEHSSSAAEYLAEFRAGEIGFVSPDLVLLEIAHVLAKRTRAKPPQLRAEEASEVFAMFLELNIPLVSTRDLVEEALGIGLSRQSGIYDAVFVALARRIGAKVLSADSKMASTYLHDDVIHLVSATADA